MPAGLHWLLMWIMLSSPLIALASNEAIFHGDNLALVDLVYERQIIGDGLDLYASDEQYFVPLAPLVAALEVSGQGSEHHFALTMPNDEVWHIGQRDQEWFISKGENVTQLDQPEIYFYEGTLYVTPDVIRQFLGVDLDLDFSESALFLFVDGVDVYPFQRRLSRQQRDAPGQSLLGESSFPRIASRYEWFETPSLDIRLNQAATRYEDDRYENVNSTYYTARSLGDFLGMSTEGFISGIREEGLTAATIRMERFDSERQLLGPLQLSQVSIGDMVYPSLPLTPSSYGRGILLGNESVRGDSQQDVQSIEGDYFPGWEVELYLNGALIGYQVIGDDGHYAFEEVVLFSGENNFTLKLYGPNGQQDELNRQIVLGEHQANSRRWTYSLSVSQPDQTVIDVADENIDQQSDDYRAVFSSKLALMDRLYLNFGIQNESITQEIEPDGALINDPVLYQKNDYSYFNVGVNAYIGSNRLSLQRIEEQDGPVNYRVDLGGYALYTRYLFAYERYDESGAFNGIQYSSDDHFRRYKTDFSMNTRIGSMSAIYRTLYEDFSKGNNWEHRLGASGKLWRLTWSSNIRYQKTLEQLEQEQNVIREMSGATFLGMSIRPANFRITSAYTFKPEAELISVGFMSAVRLDSKTNLDFSVNKSLVDDSVLSRLGLSWAHDSFRVTPSIAYSDKGFWQGQVQLAATLGKRQGRLGNYYKLGSDPTLSNGAARLRFFEDENGDGLYQRGEKLLSGGEVHAVQARRKARSNGAGVAWLESMPSWEPTDVVVNENLLDDGYMSLAIDEFAVVPRPGRVTELDMPFVRVGEIDGRVAMVDGTYELPANAVLIGLVNEAGELVAEHYTDSEGYFTFPRVSPGQYQVTTPNNEMLSRSHEVITITRKGEYISDLFITIKMKSFETDIDWLESLDNKKSEKSTERLQEGNEPSTSVEKGEDVFVETFAIPPAQQIKHTVISEVPSTGITEDETPVQQDEQRAVETASKPAEDAWVLQVGSFTQVATAKLLADKLREEGFGASLAKVVVNSKDYHRVYANGFLDRQSALTAKPEIDRLANVRSILTKL